MEGIINWLVDQVWGTGLVVFALGVGLLFTIMTRFVQPKKIRDQ